ncbi:hypothetical protein WMY93_008166 [Mugilogobius chulae]|uniref:Anoctamin n=1 Tax=Mugilogobius chulae TaxID=88201 RepID=A0AAW0PF74_9GOBI
MIETVNQVCHDRFGKVIERTAKVTAGPSVEKREPLLSETSATSYGDSGAPGMPSNQADECTFDYVLVANTDDTDLQRGADLKYAAKAFIKVLKNKKHFSVTTEIHSLHLTHPAEPLGLGDKTIPSKSSSAKALAAADVKEYKHENKIFYCLRAPDKVFERYTYLIKVSDSCNWTKDVLTQSTRIRIVHFILHKAYTASKEKLCDLIASNVFECAFCLHEDSKQKYLKEKWAGWNKLFIKQPFKDIKKYFGEKVALYFLWLSWYTWMLLLASVLGVVVFLYGLAVQKNNTIIKEVCESNITMCPPCDKRCQVWQLSDTCMYAKLNLLFDNEATVWFAMFMAIWTTVFLELWERKRAKHVSKWKVYDWCEEEEELILKVINNRTRRVEQLEHSYLQSTIILILVTLMLMIIIGLAHVLVVFRVVVSPVLSEVDSAFFSDHADIVTMILGAVLHYITIQVMAKVNRRVARKLSKMERHKSFASRHKSFTVKMFTFQFFTLFSSLFYVAFFLGRINGYPGNYTRLVTWRLQECHPSGCLTDLFIQMAIIMLLKQMINSIFEYLVPKLKKIKNEHLMKKRVCGGSRKNRCDNQHDIEMGDKVPQYIIDNYNLTETDDYSLFDEFLEMVMQFSFTTIFVAAFPLAPLLALINNIFEIRGDAIKMVSLERRLVPRKTNNIGVWTQVLESVGGMAVLANGLVIGITSDFIPRLVYRYRTGPCAAENETLNCMSGYIRNTLSVANWTHEAVRKDFQPRQMVVTDTNVTVNQCSYRDYRSSEDYSLTSQFWLVLAVRFVFVILFQHVVLLCKFIVRWFVHSNPTKVTNKRVKAKHIRLKEELDEMKKKKLEESLQKDWL